MSYFKKAYHAGTLNMGNNKITALGTPTVSTDATTKAYVDAATYTEWIRPPMSGFSAPAGYNVSTNSINPLYPNYWQAFDNTVISSSNWWHSLDEFKGAGETYNGSGIQKSGISPNGAWIVLTLADTQIISQYTVNPRIESSDGRPVNWYLIYSTDGVNYSVGHTVIANPTATYTAVVNNITPILARYVGIHVMKVNSPNKICLISDISFKGFSLNTTTKSYIDEIQPIKPTFGYVASTTGAVVICSVRKVKASYTGACCRIRRSSDNVEQDIFFDRFSLVDKTSFDTFVGGGTGFIKIMYDQSGNGYNYQQLTTASQPTLVFTGDIPEILFNIGDQNKHFHSTQTTATMGLNLGAYSLTTVFDTSSTSLQFPFAGTTSGYYECQMGSPLTNIRLIVNNNVRDFTTTNWTTAGYHRLTTLCGAGNSNVRFDGTTNTPQAVTIDTLNVNLIWGFRGSSLYDFEGKMNELIVWNIVPSDAVLLAIENDQVALWTNNTKTTLISANYYNGKIINSKAIASYTDPLELVSKGYADEKVTAPLTTVTDTSVAVFDGATGKVVKQTPVLISNGGAVTGVSSLTTAALTATGAVSMNGSNVNITNTGTTTINPTGALSLKTFNCTGLIEATDFKTATHTSFNTDITNLETKTQNQTATAGNTNFLGTTNLTAEIAGATALKIIDGDVDMNFSNLIRNLSEPQENGDAATKLYVDSAKPYIDLTPTTVPTLVEGRIYYDALVDNLLYAKNNNWYQITSSIYYPINSANLKGWFDASNPSSVSQSAGNVTVWNDVSGNGFNLTGITSTPRTGDTTFNSKNVVNLDGTEVIYRSADTINYTTHTIVMVCSTGVNKDMYGSGNTGDGNVLLTITGDKFRGHYWKGVVDNVFDSSYTANTSMSIRVQRVSTTTMDLIENGNTKKNTFIITGTSSGTSKGIYIGWRNATPGFSGLTGSVAEVLVYDTNLSDTDLNYVGTYLANKWGLTWTNINNTYAAISTPLFTAATTGNFTATASTEYPSGGGLYAWYTFNQNTGTPGWASNSNTYTLTTGVPISGSLGGFTGSWVKLRILTPVLVSSLNFTTNISTEEPKRWRVLYSNDDITWNTADSTYAASDFNSYSPGTGVSSTGIISFPSPVTCRYIAIIITKNNGAVNTAIREIYYA